MSFIGTGYNFTSDGLQLNHSAAAVFNATGLPTVLTAANIAKLDNAGCMTVWVDADYFTAVAAGNEALFSAATNSGLGTYIWLAKDNASSTFRTRNSGTFSAQNAQMSAIGKTAKVRVDWTWNNNVLRMYVDGMLMHSYTWAAGKVAALFSYIMLGYGSSGGSINTSRMRNFQLSTRPVMLAVHPLLRDVVVFGHSFTVGSDYCNRNGAIVGQAAASATNYNASGYATLQGYLQLKGLGIGVSGVGLGSGLNTARICSYGVSGSAISAINGTQIGVAQAANHRHPTLAIVMTGINDVAGSINSTTFTSNLVATIDAIIALGTTKIVITNMTTTAMNTTSYFPTAAQLAAIDTGNAIIATMETLYPDVVKVVDIFTLMGGHTNYLLGTDFIADNIHPTDTGYNKIWLQGIAPVVYLML